MDDCLLENDILCLTETQCEAGSDTSIIKSALQKKYTILTTVIITSKVLLMVCQIT